MDGQSTSIIGAIKRLSEKNNAEKRAAVVQKKPNEGNEAS